MKKKKTSGQLSWEELKAKMDAAEHGEQIIPSQTVKEKPVKEKTVKKPVKEKSVKEKSLKEKTEKDKTKKEKPAGSSNKVLDTIKYIGALLLSMLISFGGFVRNKVTDLLKNRKKATQRRLRYHETHTPEEYKRYRKNELIREGLVGLLCIAVLIVIILLFIGIFRFFGFVGSKLFSQRQPQTEMTETETETEKIYEVKDITIGSTGSLMLHSPFIDSYPDAEGNYDFSQIFRFITPYYSAPDFMTCEFEGALTGGDYSGYPSFKSPDVFIENMRDSGIDLQMIASNHIYDGWTGGFQRTMDTYDELGIAYTGVRQNKYDKKYYVANINGVKVGFTDYVYETSSYTNGEKSLNGLVLLEEDAPRVNSFDPDDEKSIQAFYKEMQENIRQMKAEDVQFIIAQMHWGIEYHLEEAEYQDKIAQKLCDMGVGAIIGGHPHCEQPIDLLTSTDGSHKTFCIYSEGNALSNQRLYLMMDDMPTGHTEDGVMITLSLHRDRHGEVTITDVEMLPTWVYRFSEPSGSKYYILPLDDVENIEKNTGISDIKQEAKDSYDRTIEELKPGLDKVKQYLQTVKIEPETEEVSSESELET